MFEYDKPEALRKIALAAQDSAREKIQKLIEEENHQYAHNIVSIVLRNLASSYGHRYADELVDELNLYEMYGIASICTE
jgi:hypothetical protein